MEKFKQLLSDCIEHLKSNPALALVLALALVFAVVVLIVIITLGVKRSKAQKRLTAEQTSAPQEEREAKEQPQPTVTDDEPQEPQQEEQETIEPNEPPVQTATVKEETVDKKAVYEENETDKIAKYSGKWLICRVITDDEKETEETYFFELRASNGEKLLSSEEYTSYNGALRGIQTHKSNIEKGNFKITVSKKGDYIFKLLGGKNTLLCMGENYPTLSRCESAIESTKRFAKTAVLDENIQDQVIKLPPEEDAEPATVYENSNGKWIIFNREGVNGEKLFYFELFANNGEKLLSSEDYTSYAGAVNGLQTHKTNIEKDNFRISLTKRGDYIYKLLNGNGQLLCLGEHYKTKRRCQNAVESVKRFASNSPVLTDPTVTK
ncbi:MAG: DUF1508 domain-containing protein [Clostridiales bacterium]|nr:DUF1508 domain-containing protein [Clostridiales bacterium]